MKQFRKSICLVLVVMLLVGMTGAFATASTNPDRYDYDCYGGYNTYMCIGDSIAAGYTVSGIYMDPVGLGFQRVTGAYHDLVATGINADLLQMGCSAFRCVELRYILDGFYSDTDGIWNMAFAQAFALENLDALRPYYIGAIQASDIITINLGSNDILSYSYIRAMLKMYEDNSTDAQKAVKAWIEENGGDVGQAFLSMLSSLQSIGKLPAVLAEFTAAFNEAFNKYKQDWNAALKAIYELNPDVQIITVGVYNPANNISITEGGSFKVGPFMQPFVDQINAFLKSGHDYAKQCPFADVTGTETWPISVTGGDFTAKYNWCSHPTRAGHMYMASKIMEVIPNRYVEEEPVVDPTDDPTTDPADDPTTDPADDPTTNPADDPTTDPADDPTTDPADDPTTDPADDPTTDPTDDPTTDPADDPTDDPADDPVKEFPFKDVKEGDWSYDDIYYVWDNGIMKGMEDDLFVPQGTTTRAQFALVIYRMAGSPTVTEEDYAKCPFTDLVDDWYKDAVVWAYNAKVVTGVTDTTFVPGANITREQMVAMLYRYSGETGAAGDLSKIKDADAISDYAKPAVAWAVANGIISGFPDGTFQPNGNATREQMAAVITRFDKLGK